MDDKKEGRSINYISSEFINQIPLIVIGFDPKGKLLYWNDRAKDITGRTKSEVKQCGISFLSDIFFPEAVNDKLPSKNHTTLLQDLISNKIELTDKIVPFINEKGETHYMKWNSYIVQDKNDKFSNILIITGQDDTVCNLLQKELLFKSKYIKTIISRLKKFISLDPHTGLLNYRHFIHKLNKNFYKSFETGVPVSLVLMNLDYFYSINSTHGISRGNQILRRLAMLIKNSVSEDFIVARFSGSEFAILMPGLDTKSAFNISKKLFSIISDSNFTFQGFDHAIKLSLHMAVGGWPHCEDVYTPEQLFDRVRGRMQQAKKQDVGTPLICSPNEVVLEEELALGPFTVSPSDYKYTVEFVNALANAVKMKDFYTQKHSTSMSSYAVYMAHYIGMNREDIQKVRFGSILHDIGKIGIDKKILLKPGSLSDAEYAIIKQHPRIGAEIIRHVHPLKDVVPFVLHHHERFDGEGYLDGLKGEEIPIGARIISIADVFQALISDRPYRKALSEKKAISIIQGYSGTFFDPKVVGAFLEVYKSVD